MKLPELNQPRPRGPHPLSPTTCVLSAFRSGELCMLISGVQGNQRALGKRSRVVPPLWNLLEARTQELPVVSMCLVTVHCCCRQYFGFCNPRGLPALAAGLPYSQF